MYSVKLDLFGGLMSHEHTTYKLTHEQILTIEAVVNRGDRVEVVPVKDGLKILRTRRELAKLPRMES